MHSDHTAGLSSSFKKGKIYATPTTCRLVENKYSLPHSIFVPMEIGQRYFLTNVENSKVIAWIHDAFPNQSLISERIQQNEDVTDISGERRIVCIDVIEANHCPGACIFLFSIYRWDTSAHLFFTTLYTGDFRYTPQILSDSVLQEYTKPSGKQIDHVYIDNTYCQSKYKFPPQKVVIHTVIHVLKTYYSSLLYSPKEIVVLFGTYWEGEGVVSSSRGTRSKSVCQCVGVTLSYEK